MANALYRQDPASGAWFNQANPGGPTLMKVEPSVDPITAVTGWVIRLTWGTGVTWITGEFPDQTTAQNDLNIYAAALNGGTA